MARIDVSALLNPVAQDAPCGPNLEYDPAFGELERAALGKPERVSGNKTLPAEEPDWNDVVDRALELFGRTKDLRVSIHLLNGALRTGGLAAAAPGFELIRQLLSEQWEAVHPLLDKDDGDDPTLRMNTLVSLNDRAGVVGALSRCTLVESKALGRVTLRDVRIASGEIAKPADGPPPLDPAHVSAAFLDADLAELEASTRAAAQCVEHLEQIVATLNERVGSTRTPDLGVVTTELEAISDVLSGQLSRRGGTGAAVESPAPARASGTVAVGEITSRDDVVRVLDRICEYFQKNEPSSPIPLLLKRARRLVSADFMDILNDLTPDAVNQAKVIVGYEEKKE